MPKWDELACPQCGNQPNGLNVELVEKHYTSQIPNGSWRGYRFECYDCGKIVTVKIETRDKEKNV